MCFYKTYEIAADVNAVIPLTLDEARAIDALNMRGLLTTNSFYFTIEATGKLASRSTLKISARGIFIPGGQNHILEREIKYLFF